MPDSFYPFMGNPGDYNYQVATELPKLKEFAYDFDVSDFIIDEKTKDIKVVEGKEALKVWIHKAILTNRFEHEVFSWDYGTELITLIGQKFSRGLTESEAFRYIKEALMINPYITDISNRSVSFSDDIVTINISVDSVYGEVAINVRK